MEIEQLFFSGTCKPHAFFFYRKEIEGTQTRIHTHSPGLRIHRFYTSQKPHRLPPLSLRNNAIQNLARQPRFSSKNPRIALQPNRPEDKKEKRPHFGSLSSWPRGCRRTPPSLQVVRGQRSKIWAPKPIQHLEPNRARVGALKQQVANGFDFL